MARPHLGRRARPRRTCPWASGLLGVTLACGDTDSPAPEPAPAPEHASTGAPTSQPPPPPGAFEIPGLDAMRPRPRLGWPVESVHLTSSFGWRVDPVSGQGVRLHRGIDLRGAPGDLVLSIGDGHVDFVGHDPLLGNLVIVDHGQGLQSLYGHLSDVLVAAQMPVQRGAAIGLVGNTGRSAAPHLHLTVKLDGQAIDPLEVIGEPLHRPEALVTADDPVDAPTASSSSDGAGAAPGSGSAATEGGVPIPSGTPHAPPHLGDEGGR